MKLRVAKKILKNQDNFKYAKHQIKKATTIVGRYERNKTSKESAEGQSETTEPSAQTPTPEVEKNEANTDSSAAE